MKIFLLSQDMNSGYDTFDSAVVASENENEAKRIDPSGFREWSDEKDCWMFMYSDGGRRPEESHNSWVDHIDKISVTEIGIASPNIKKGIICASFNAG